MNDDDHENDSERNTYFNYQNFNKNNLPNMNNNMQNMNKNKLGYPNSSSNINMNVNMKLNTMPNNYIPNNYIPTLTNPIQDNYNLYNEEILYEQQINYTNQPAIFNNQAYMPMDQNPNRFGMNNNYIAFNQQKPILSNNFQSNRGKQEDNFVNSNNFNFKNKGNMNYTDFSDEELAKNAIAISKDQCGCRFLQKKMRENSQFANGLLFNDLQDHLMDLILDPLETILYKP